jgi:hypothetical protein
MDHQLDARGTGIGEQPATVRKRRTDDLHHAGQQPIGAAVHVHQRSAQPQAINAGHFNCPATTSRRHATKAQSRATNVGQSTPRRDGARSTPMQQARCKRPALWLDDQLDRGGPENSTYPNPYLHSKNPQSDTLPGTSLTHSAIRSAAWRRSVDPGSRAQKLVHAG